MVRAVFTSAANGLVCFWPMCTDAAQQSDEAFLIKICRLTRCRSNQNNSIKEEKLNVMSIARDVFIYWCLTFLGGAAVGYTAGLLGAAQSPAFHEAIAFSSLLFGVVAFFIAGMLTKRHRLGHLVVLTFVVWLTNMVNIFAFGVTAVQWLYGLGVLLVLMFVGGGASYLLAPPAKKTAPEDSESGVSDAGSDVGVPGHSSAD